MSVCESVREKLAEEYGDEELLFADGFDEAIVGVVTRCSFEIVVCYDVEKCIKILMADMSREDAEEYFSFNVSGAYVGPKTPMWLSTLEALQL